MLGKVKKHSFAACYCRLRRLSTMALELRTTRFLQAASKEKNEKY